ncbi:MAG: peptidylprolyl isomerase [Candidatus Hydrogenedentota bacterium]|uniref:Peptidyl-prolyl cis-trans isomerase n=1 Tax=Sumerlaea chitinivorans TaxID=2250252 RepID=A0A2Z4Y2G4_SUMC1|nr:Peptidyl-prolyl cis-trans isomerase [Candidatus Sumerlaea chitinivorans]MCX7964807.1 peptidylprolyl isomerase [Candidatus Sumerlaea chitinivorans]RMH26819.1 MAG: peptidylprolyl isomerase [Candidatus Hydrogenedentota bacterium]GIX44421.1 MAG: peptidyl-prolyl cis-trans isomerase [Candidatus Sumerlaea sp.]
MKKSFLLALLIGAGLVGAAPHAQAKPYAIFHTSKGDFIVELLPEKAPKTVENFIGLATGRKTWKHPATNEVMTSKPLYNGTVFHRTIPKFMIQGGDPLGNGTGTPGYEFEDEFSDLKFDAPGYLAMANRGPNTNGSQFFITVAPTPHLNNRHTIFGKVVSGMDVVVAISELPSEPGTGRALNPVKLNSVEIVDSLPSPKPAASDAATTK